MFERYKRQTILPEVLDQGQKNLTSSKILVAGAGGLASSALQYLVGAGCGNITIYDEDNVSETNLHRQTIYNGVGTITLYSYFGSGSSNNKESGCYISEIRY